MYIAVVSGVYNIELTMEVQCFRLREKMALSRKLYTRLKKDLQAGDGWLDDADKCTFFINTHQLALLRDMSIKSDFVVVSMKDCQREVDFLQEKEDKHRIDASYTQLRINIDKAIQMCIDKAHADKLKAKHIDTPQRRRSGL